MPHITNDYIIINIPKIILKIGMNGRISILILLFQFLWEIFIFIFFLSFHLNREMKKSIRNRDITLFSKDHDIRKDIGH
jgi:hypothetical protein